MKLENLCSGEVEAAEIEELDVTSVDGPILRGWARVKGSRGWGFIACADDGGDIISLAIACLFCEEAFAKGVGYGWAGFEIDLTSMWDDLRSHSINFKDCINGNVLIGYDIPDVPLDRITRSDEAISAAEFIEKETIFRSQPTARELSLYADEFLRLRGAAEFVRRAYSYVLDREPDVDGFQNYSMALAQGLRPYQMLDALLASDEYLARQQNWLARPGEAAFPFYV